MVNALPIFLKTFIGDLFVNQEGVLDIMNGSMKSMEGTLSFRHKFWNMIDVNAVAGMGRYLDKGTGMTVSYQNANDMIMIAIWLLQDGPFLSYFI